MVVRFKATSFEELFEKTKAPITETLAAALILLTLCRFRALPGLYQEFGKAFAGLDSWSCYMITSYEEVQKYFGRQADKNRKIYNGMLKTYFYQFMGLRPPKKKPEQ